jgi:aldose 1-epimerase
MTCPPDAFNSGTDLVVLEPGARHEVTWHIAAVTA